VSVLHALLLGMLQGATEFLPVSSSGHLVLVPWLLGWPDPGLTFDAVVHWGTALAVIAYFWRDWVALARAVLRSAGLTLRRAWTKRVAGRPAGADASPGRAVSEASEGAPDALLAWYIILGTLPAAIIGYLLEGFFAEMFSRPPAVAAFLLVTAALLAVAERLGRRERGLDALTWRDALFVGLGQALAIFPGISRSGATIAAGLARGVRRAAAARFSFLLATPVILGAGLFELLDLLQEGGAASLVPVLVVGFLAAGLVGFGCIHFLLRYLQRRRLYPFAAYCAAVGAACLIVWLVRGG